MVYIILCVPRKRKRLLWPALRLGHRVAPPSGLILLFLSACFLPHRPWRHMSSWHAISFVLSLFVFMMYHLSLCVHDISFLSVSTVRETSRCSYYLYVHDISSLTLSLCWWYIISLSLCCWHIISLFVLMTYLFSLSLSLRVVYIALCSTVSFISFLVSRFVLVV
jgi:hypothetical protein